MRLVNSLRVVLEGFVRSLVLVVLTGFVPCAVVASAILSFHTAVNVVLAWWWLCWLVFFVLLACTRLVCQAIRILVTRWTGTEIAAAYRPIVPLTRMSTGYWWNGFDYRHSRWQAAYLRWVRVRVRDPAAWRDTLWMVVSPFTVGVAAALPLALLVVSVAGFLRPALVASPLVSVASLIAGVALLPVGWRFVGPIASRLLGPSLVEMLSARIENLVVGRGDLTQAQDAELHRIERNLHDGAQARLVAIGLSVATAERLIDTDPRAAKELLAQTRKASVIALRELRALVRGIVPPVLTERGLVEAVRALALDAPTPTRVRSGLSHRVELPIEAALYFAIAELVANAGKHAEAAVVDIEIDVTPTGIVVVVSDDGRGGVDEGAGSGFAGVRARLAAFDGSVVVDSPHGGPTRITLEVPCALS